MNGLLVIDKPGGMTSRDAVNRIQKWFPRRTRIGHTGTLDPLATGVLVLCIGPATRLAEYVQAMGKSYAARFRLGAVSTTDDADGEVSERCVEPVPAGGLHAALASFVGTIEQVPPAYSALKIDGGRAHLLARKGAEVRLAARPVRIAAIRVQRYEWPFLELEIDCGKGTYIRSIARDLGIALGCGGLVQTLRRTRIGPFTVERAMSLDADPAKLELLPPHMAVEALPTIRLDSAREERFRRGLPVDHPAARAAEWDDSQEVVVSSERGAMVGIALRRENQLRPVIVLNEQSVGGK